MLLGTAAGDSIGLPAEGIVRARNARLFQGRWRHRFLCGRGMISDDTEHALFAAQCLLATDSPDRFLRRLAWCLRLWLLGLPAGIGLATARAILRLWVGFGPARSGVFSAGNGPAMRAAPLGACFAADAGQLDRYVGLSTRITHTDPKAEIGARAVARLAAWIVREERGGPPSLAAFESLLRAAAGGDAEWAALVGSLRGALEAGVPVDAFADTLGLARGVTGYIYHTVPVVLFAWHRHYGDFEAALTAVFRCGGDTDTTGAILGGLAGLTVGEDGIPVDWIRGIADWPRSTALLRRVADRLAERAGRSGPMAPVRYFWPGLIVRNALFLAVVLGHGFRRLLPPYGPGSRAGQHHR
ncbi:MAG: ADP-ribosylglycohydrolase family protein [Kiritimatiellae bacterium]|nr:ADP-ribosylglycohydrolase family protein [Kiritimatiellia bacterium]